MEEEAYYNEKQLLDAIAVGNELAFTALFNQYRDFVFAIAWKIIRVRSAAEDVVQDVFLKIWQGREKLSEVVYIQSYLNTITTRHIYNLLRHVAYEYDYIAELNKQGRESTNDPLSKTSLKQLQETLHRSITRLPEQQRKVYLLSKQEGLKRSEIAAKLAISSATVKYHLIEATRNIKNKLSASGFELLVFLMAYLYKNNFLN